MWRQRTWSDPRSTPATTTCKRRRRDRRRTEGGVSARCVGIRNQRSQRACPGRVAGADMCDGSRGWRYDRQREQATSRGRRGLRSTVEPAQAIRPDPSERWLTRVHRPASSGRMSIPGPLAGDHRPDRDIRRTNRTTQLSGTSRLAHRSAERSDRHDLNHPTRLTCTG
jgi:hypothetical protein